MKLIELEPEFYRYESRVETYSVIEGDQATWRERGCPVKNVTGPVQYKIPVVLFAEAQCVWFKCPKCLNHFVEVTFKDRGVSEEMGTHNSKGVATRWAVSGTEFNNLTLTPSIQLEGGCNWHGYVTNGDAA